MKNLQNLFATAQAAFTTEHNPQLPIGEYKATIVGFEEAEKKTETDTKVRTIITFETETGIKTKQSFYPRKDWMEITKLAIKGKPAAHKEAYEQEAKYGYIKSGIANQIFNDLQNPINLPDFKTFMNVLIQNKVEIKIIVSEEAITNKQTGEIKTVKNIWFY